MPQHSKARPAYTSCMRVFVTGGANGICRAAVDRLLDAGHEVSVFDVDADALAALPEGVETFHGDVADRDAVESAVEAAAPFDVVVNGAGYQAWGAIEDLEPGEVEQHFATNVDGLLNVTRAALPVLREREGRVVNVASLAGHITAPYWGMYSATKHAVEAISDALRMEVQPFNVDVVIVEPGPVRTGFNERGRDHLEQLLPETVYAGGYRAALDRGGLGGVSPETAGRVVVKAVTANRPRTRYTVGWQAWLAPKLRCILPERVWDWLVQRF